MSTNFEELEHTADLCARIYGETLHELFIHAAEGTFALMSGLCKGPENAARSISLTSIDPEGLLVDWLSELLYLSEQYHETYTAFTVQIIDKGTQLIGHARGHKTESVERGIKAVTYSNLEIIQNDRGFQTTITFDV